MLKNLFRVAYRTLVKDKAYSLLNILGLTIGITFSLLLIFYIKDELGYDRYHEKADRIYRIVSYINEKDKSSKWAVTQYPLGPTLKKDYSQVEQAVRFVGTGKAKYKHGDKEFYEDKIFAVDSNIFTVFTYSFLEGSPQVALFEPHTMVITQTVAEKFFGKGKKVVGQTLEKGQEVFRITGVVKDPPRNSHLLFNGLISASTLPKDFSNNFGNFGFYTYVLLYPNSNYLDFEKKLIPMYAKYMAPIFAQFNVKIHYGVQPMTKIHLYSDLDGEPEELGSITYIYTFSAVALFMLLIACINYMNLTTARSARRAKEIGVRKVTGSLRSQLIAQFLIESTIISLIALLLSMALVYFLLPSFNKLAGKFISFGNLFEPVTFLILIGIMLFIGIVGGSYPAFYLSKFNPVTVLKGKLSKSSSNSSLRIVLVTIQFSISIIMLICTLVVYAQLKFMREKDLGFNKDRVMSIQVNGDGDFSGQIKALKNELKKNPSILSVSTAQTPPGSQGTNYNLFSIQTNTGYVDRGIDNYAIDEDFLQTLGITLVSGRNFSGLPDTLRRVIVNENMAKTFGWTNAIGKHIRNPGDTSDKYLEVIGMVKDFNQKSLYNPITPLMLFYNPTNGNLQVKLSSENIPTSLAYIEKTWKAIIPGLPFQYTFMDQDYESQYAADQKRGKIFTAFSSLTILITCLGLLGLVAFTTEQRQKEISIRKIMGADMLHILPLISKNYLILVGISCLFAFPVAWYFMHRWLQIFAYKSELRVSTFLIAGFIVLAITMLTVSFHTIKSAFANPVNSLRTE